MYPVAITPSGDKIVGFTSTADGGGRPHFGPGNEHHDMMGQGVSAD